MILYQIFSVLSYLIYIYSFALIIYIFMSWVPSTRETAVGRFLATDLRTVFRAVQKDHSAHCHAGYIPDCSDYRASVCHDGTLGTIPHDRNVYLNATV